MKKMLMLVVMFGIFGWIEYAWCQTQEKSASDMQAEIAALQVKLVDAQTKEGKFTSQFAGFGKELGVAFNGFVEAMDGGMKVTTERVNDFAKTDVGKFAMVGIGWKIFATDILGMVKSTVRTVLGLVFLGIFCFVLKKGIEVFFWGRMIVTKTEGPWYKKNITKERSTPLIKTLAGNSSEQQTCVGLTALIVVVLLFANFIAAMVMLP